MPATNNNTYLNTAACGLISPSVLKAGTGLYDHFAQNSSGAAEHWRDVERLQIKENIAGFIGAPAADIALIPNFSFGMNAVVQALTGREKVLLYKKDFPSVYAPFVINKFDIVWLDDENGFTIDPDKIESIIREQHIDLVAISHVQWQSGFRLNIKALCLLCRQHGVRTIIDATQSLGAVDLQIPDTDPDVLISSNYKWMNAGFGNGILYMNPRFAAQYPAKITGMNSNTFHIAGNGFSFDGGVANYEPGSLNMFGFAVLNQAILEKKASGMPFIEQHNRALTKMLLEELASLPVSIIGPAAVEHRSSIVVLEDKNGLHAHLSQNNVITTGRNGLVRISIHLHNTEADIDTVVCCIKDWAKL
ncbi:aminotransferase class V-fold PLP-dependent enzyme [Niabella drilacis]|uniref:Selenocysteine lyase/Cysteine desulfurase n=1 Tax=Niabella drilacis (strain DSM 25811 / CCM 8410 / CCUG 62505 / LMG 26954 / E90) TaxID=1285928 RepID=A0A1G6XAU1_NIADE|nr:aminotransferase class V-fold PLP-dependent enzyme [Niabella drilacis]SDD75329.1 Selenocysteine lyase/Cysteine desulfurase [Niabella drilacis]